MALPLFDGVFISIVLSGGLETVYDAILVGSFVLGGGATVSVILSEFNSNMIQSIKRIILVSIVVSIIATIQAVFAPVIEPFINTELFTKGAVLALIALAIQIFPDERTDQMISPIIIIVITVILSVNFSSPAIGSIEFERAVYAIIAVLTAMVISISTVICKEYVTVNFNQDILKYGTSIGLVFISLTILFPIPSSLPFIIISSAVLFSISP